MSCCGKTKTTKVKRLLEQPGFIRDSLKLLNKFENIDPSTLKNQTLLDYHKKIHMIYASNIKRRPINKSFINSIVKLHTKFVKEITKRKMKHNSPLLKI